MAAYNVVPYIDEAIQSVLSQKRVSFELLIGDDVSTDHTWDRIENYRKDPRVRVWRLKRRRGAGPTRNRLIREARGSYLCICDSDDVMLQGHLLAGMELLDAQPSAGVVYGNLRAMSDFDGSYTSWKSRGPSEMWDLVEGHVGHPGTMIRRSCFETVGGYREGFKLIEDYDLFLRLAEVTRFRPTGKALYLYRIRSGSLSRSPHRLQREMLRRLRRDAIFRRYGYQVSW